MSHKTIIAGTSYDITGGTNLADGTIFHIGGGRTLVNGTLMHLNFGRTVTVTTDAKFEGQNLSKSQPNMLITCNGVTYTMGPKTAEDQANKTFTAKTGDSITLSLGADGYYSYSYWNVILPDGSSISDGPVTFTLTADTTITIRGYSDASGTAPVMSYRVTVQV